MATFIIGSIVFGAMAFVVINTFVKKKKGKGGCSGGCSGCKMANSCQSLKINKNI